MSDEQTIRRSVAAMLRRQLGQGNTRTVIDEMVVNGVAEGGTLEVPPGALVTPLAQSTALTRRVKLVTTSDVYTHMEGNTVAIGADHGGFAMKEMLKGELQARNTPSLIAAPTAPKVSIIPTSRWP